MTLPATARFPFAADLSICRILNGMWQVSGAHGAIDPARAVEAMFAYHDAGFTTWDLADHYGPAEDLVGNFRRQFATRYGAERLPESQAFTKWVPRPGPMTRRTELHISLAPVLQPAASEDGVSVGMLVSKWPIAPALTEAPAFISWPYSATCRSPARATW